MRTVLRSFISRFPDCLKNNKMLNLLVTQNLFIDSVAGFPGFGVWNVEYHL